MSRHGVLDKYPKMRLLKPNSRATGKAVKCKLKGCSKASSSRGLCDYHYVYMKRKDLLGYFPKTHVRGVCIFIGCKKPHYGLGWCFSHYCKFRDDPRKKGKCRRCNCSRLILAKKMCHNCYHSDYEKPKVGQSVRESIMLAVQLTYIHDGFTAALWHREFAEQERATTDRYLERLKKTIKEFGIPFRAVDDRYYCEVKLTELNKYLRRRT